MGTTSLSSFFGPLLLISLAASPSGVLGARPAQSASPSFGDDLPQAFADAAHDQRPLLVVFR